MVCVEYKGRKRCATQFLSKAFQTEVMVPIGQPVPLNYLSGACFTGPGLACVSPPLGLARSANPWLFIEPGLVWLSSSGHLKDFGHF
ncbi:hypothetical protein RRG08_066321 [Elysia crispata]|uniref:Uncharacterized protein n=1 Tax=Elysia crispata TaxID=231223 RepID=A0AAE1E4Q8_9GAST|nr:hypothetical protein RRG08_066321 [Elysia crispata]